MTNGKIVVSVVHEQSVLEHVEHWGPSSTPEHNRVIFSEVSRDQIVSNYYLLVFYMSGACSNTSILDSGTREQGSPSAFEHP